MESVMYLVEFAFLKCFLRSLFASAPGSYPPLIQLMAQNSGWNETELGLLGNLSHKWGNLALIPKLYLSPLEKSRPKR